MTTCSICGGAGFVASGATNVNDPMFGRAIPCKCKRAELAALLAKESNVSPFEREWTLDSFPGDQMAKAVAMEALEVKCGIWVFVSDVGRGKSGLLISIINALAAQGYPGLYKTVPYMLAELRSGFGDGEFFDRLQGLIGVPVLALDEFHRAYEKTSGDTLHGSPSGVYQQLFMLIDERYSHWTERMTLIATNREFDKGESDPIVSRLMDSRRSRVVHVSGTDLRAHQFELADEA